MRIVSYNFLNGGEAENYVAIYEQLAEDLAEDDLEHVIVSTVTEGVKRTVGLATPVTQYTFSDLKVDTQRGRLN